MTELNNKPLFSEEELNELILPDSEHTEKIITWLAKLYDLTDWRSLLLDNNFDREYNGISTICFFKAFALPYLIKICTSERELGRLIIDRVNLQKLCGFRAGYPLYEKNASLDVKPLIGVRSLWHFRNKYKNVFSEMLVKSLILLALSGVNGNFELPFVEKIDDYQFTKTGNKFYWYLDNFRSIITISTSNVGEFQEIKESQERFEEFNDTQKERFPKEINFPIEVKLNLSSGKPLFFRLIEPDFSKTSYIFKDRPSHKDIMDQIHRLSSVDYDKASNILIIKDNMGEKQILLTQRIVNGQSGPFAVPGGKQKGNETLEHCSKRELLEETGLNLIESRPVSIYITRSSDKKEKQVVSVGVLALKWEGEPITKEPEKHSGWSWYSLSNLPENLFEYSEIAINQYVEKKYEKLTWEDFEEKLKTKDQENQDQENHDHDDLYQIPLID